MIKIESLFFYLLIFSIPIQARLILHSWTKPFNQWTSASLYGTDILLGALFILWLVRIYRHRMPLDLSTSHVLRRQQLSSPAAWLLFFFIVCLISIVNSHFIGLAFYQLIKLTAFIGFYFYLRSSRSVIFDFRSLLLIIIVSGFFQSMVAITQYIKQGGLGLRLLGESPLSVDATGVAVFFADGIKYMRAYGTTPHPNVLAAWLFVAIFALYFYYCYLYKNSNGRYLSGAGKESLLMAVYAIVLLAFFFTFSRVVIGLWGLGVVLRVLIVFFKRNSQDIASQVKSRIVVLTVVSLAILFLFSIIFWPQVKSRIHISAQEEAVTQRIYYNKIAGSAAASHPLIGVGVGQFIPEMMAKFKHLPVMAYQPAHNIYLLMVSETGFIGLSAFLLFLFFSFYRFIKDGDFKKLATFSFLFFTFSFLLVGLFDHFLWTLQQGSLIFWMTLALLNSDLPASKGGS